MDIDSILAAIKQDWASVVFFFTAGGVWMQGKTWFESVNKKLAEASTSQKEHQDALDTLSTKVDTMTMQLADIHQELTTVHEEVHEQEIKLAVLDAPTKRKRAVRR